MGIFGVSFSLLCLGIGYFLGRGRLGEGVQFPWEEGPAPLSYALPATQQAAPRLEDILPIAMEDEVPLNEEAVGLGTLPFLIWRQSRQHTIIYKNEAYKAFEKYISLRERPDSPVFYTPQEGPLLEKARKTGQESRGRLTRSILGQVFSFEVWAIPERSGDVLLCASDVSEYEREERTFKKSLRNFESTFDQLPIGVAIWGKNQHLQKFNNWFTRFFQLDEKWLESSPLLDEMLEHLRHKRLLPEVIDFSEYKRRFQVFFTGARKPYEELIHLPDERSFRLIVTSYPEGGLLWLLEDLTEPLAMKRKYNALLAISGAISHYIREGILVLSVDRRVRSLNAVCADLWGMDPQQSVGKNLTELLDSCRQHFYYTHYFLASKNVLTGRIFSRTPYRESIYRRDGTLVQCEYIPLPNGEHLLKFVDITESCKLRGVLHESRRLLMVDQYLFMRRIQQLKGEIQRRTPTEMSLESSQSPQQLDLRRLLERLQKAQNLLAESRPVVRERFALQEVVEELLKIFEPLLEEGKLRVTLVGIEDIVLSSNRVLFTRFLSRLVGTALYDAAPKAQIVLAARRGRGRLLLTLSLKAQRREAGCAPQSWYYPWELEMALLKEMAALSGGVLSAGTAHPQRIRFVCSFQDYLSTFGAEPETGPLRSSSRKIREAACG